MCFINFLDFNVTKKNNELKNNIMTSQRVDLKVVLLGKEYGGKTSLVERFLHSRFNSTIPYQNVC